MEYYYETYISNWGQKQKENVKMVSKTPEEIPDEDGTGYVIKMDHIPVAFTAYCCWSWDYYGSTFTNMLFQINPRHMWRARPEYGTDPRGIVQIEFLIQAFHKRMLNQKIKQQKHNLFENLDTCEAEKDQAATRQEFSKLLTIMNEFIHSEKNHDFPTPPKPDEFNYNSYIIFKRQDEIIGELRDYASILKYFLWKERKQS